MDFLQVKATGSLARFIGRYFMSQFTKLKV